MNSTNAGPVGAQRLRRRCTPHRRAASRRCRAVPSAPFGTAKTTPAAGCSRRRPSRRSTARCPWRPPSTPTAVSSDRWAEASKPVIVYCVSRKPNGTIANQNAKPLRAAAAVAGVVEPLGEHVAERLVLVGHDDQDQHDRRRAGDVPPHRDVVDDRQQVAAEDVQHRRRATRMTTKMMKTRVSE